MRWMAIFLALLLVSAETDAWQTRMRVVAGAEICEGTCVYVRAGAAGAGTSWTDAYNALPSTLARGTTYYIADGSYGAYIIDDAVSGTTTIVLKKATQSDHGVGTGWDNSYGDGTATFAGASTAVFGIHVLTKYVDVHGLTIGGGIDLSDGSGDPPSAIAFLNFYNVTAKWVHIVAQDVYFYNLDVGNYNPCLLEGPEDAFRPWDNGVDAASSRITLDNSKVHDVTDQGDSCAGTPVAGIHVDCMQMLGGHDITVKKSVFYNCPTSAILGESFRDTLDGLLIENNFFQNVMNPGQILSLNSAIHGTNTVQYNTALGALNVAHDGPGTIEMIGNITTVGSCGAGVWNYNLFNGGTTCGTNTRTGTPSLVFTPTPAYLNGLIPDYHLTDADTAARDRADLTSYPVDDIDGTARYLGPLPDIGAHEAPVVPIFITLINLKRAVR